jgi:hypothetical protein
MEIDSWESAGRQGAIKCRTRVSSGRWTVRILSAIFLQHGRTGGMRPRQPYRTRLLNYAR